MSIEIVTGYQGKNHVTANDIGGFQQGVVGVEDYVLGVGEKAKATLISNNSVRISDGELVMQGVHWRIKPGTYENVTINNGSQGMRRKDAIIARYRKESGTGIESIELAVLQGSPTYSTPTAPTPTTGNIRSGALKHEMLLYIVELNGLNVVSVIPAFEILMSMKELQEGFDELNSKLSKKVVGNRLTGTSGEIIADVNEYFVDITIDLSGCLVRKEYYWYDVGTVHVGFPTKLSRGSAFFHNGGPIHATNAVIRAEEQSNGTIKLTAQADSKITEGRNYMARIRVPRS